MRSITYHVVGMKNDCFYWGSQNVSYIAEHVVGTGSFGVVFQVSNAIVSGLSTSAFSLCSMLL